MQLCYLAENILRPISGVICHTTKESHNEKFRCEKLGLVGLDIQKSDALKYLPVHVAACIELVFEKIVVKFLLDLGKVKSIIT
jgi:hypothetical protein